MNDIKPELSVQQLQRFIPFDELSEFAVAALLPHFRYYQVAARKIIFKRGQADDECHFLLDGDVDLADDKFCITSVRGCDEENFLALDASHAIHRNAAVSQSPCTLIAIQRQHLELISTWIELTQSWQQSPEQVDWLEALLTSNLFNRIPAANIQKLMACFTSRYVSLGESIIRQGEEGNECFVIKAGNAIVSRQDHTQVETLAALTPGTLFGEDALISQLPRNASVTMSSDGELMVITKEDFDVLLKQPTIHYVSESELAALISDGDTGTVLLDVRQPQEVAAAPMHRAKSIPLAQLRSRLQELAREFTYVLIGASRAEAAAYVLHEAGYDAKVLKDES